MAGLQRSAVSFRRQGSSGLVWDDKFLSGELTQLANNHQKNVEDKGKKLPTDGLRIERSRSDGGRGFRSNGRVTPAAEPPSPRVSACGLCGAFGKSSNTRRRPPKSRKRVL